jgi:S1-C subfamily serine protease
VQPEREACFHCAEPVALDARVCPHCGRSALVLVALPAPVADARLRYQVARALSSRAVPVGPVNAVTGALAAVTPRLGPLTRSAAYRALEALDTAGLAGEFVPEPTGSGSRTRLFIGAGAVVALLAAGGIWLTRRTPSPAPARETQRPSAAAPAPVAAMSAPRTPLSSRSVAARVIPSTVLIRCPDSLGSGFVAGPELVLTAAHVVCRGGESMTVTTSNGATLPGFAVETDERLDLASVRVPGLEAPALELGDSTFLSPGDRVMAVGNPMGLEFTVSDGIVSSVSQVVFGVSYIQTDVKINPGNSGGPLVDDQGRAVGVVSMKIHGGEGLGFAVPLNYAWDHSPPLVEAPATADPARWQAIVARADENNQQLTQEASAALAMPVLLGTARDRYGRLVVRIGRASSAQPRFEEITLRAYRGSEVVCTLKGDVTEWRAVPAGRSADSRLQAWLDANRLAQSAWVGDAAVSTNHCPPGGGVIELEGGNPEANRAPY